MIVKGCPVVNGEDSNPHFLKALLKMIKMWILRHFGFYLKSSNLFDIVLLHLFHLLLDQVLLVEELGSQGRHLTLEKKNVGNPEILLKAIK